MLRGSRGARAAERITRNIIPVVDTHQHLWYKEKWNSAGLAELCKQKSHTVESYQDGTHFLDVIASVFVETDAVKEDFAKETSFVTREICPHPDNVTMGVIGHVDFNSKQMPSQVNRHTNVPEERKYFKGVRDIGHVRPPGYLATHTAVDNYQYCGDQGLLVEIITRPEDLPLIIPAVKACRGTTFVLNHMGGVQGLKGMKEKENVWARAMEQLGQEFNVVCKISGMAGGWGDDPRVDANGWSFDLQERYVRHALQCFSDTKIIFGTDWPVCDYIKGADLLNYVEGVQRVAKEVGGQYTERRLFYENALNLYAMTLTGKNEKYTPKEMQERFTSQNRISHKWPEKKQMAEGDMSIVEMYWTVGGMNRSTLK